MKVSMILRITIIALCIATVIIPWVWNACILAMESLSAMGLAVVGMVVAIGILVINTGEPLHCKIIEGLMGCLMVIAGLLQLRFSGNDCNVLALLICLLAAGVIFIVDMVLLILGKE